MMKNRDIIIQKGAQNTPHKDLLLEQLEQIRIKQFPDKEFEYCGIKYRFRGFLSTKDTAYLASMPTMPEQLLFCLKAMSLPPNKITDEALEIIPGGFLGFMTPYLKEHLMKVFEDLLPKSELEKLDPQKKS